MLLSFTFSSIQLNEYSEQEDNTPVLKYIKDESSTLRKLSRALEQSLEDVEISCGYTVDKINRIHFITISINDYRNRMISNDSIKAIESQKLYNIIKIDIINIKEFDEIHFEYFNEKDTEIMNSFFTIKID